ncbi:uncharacterized protein LOC126672568 [Mercurialis annua]|uniref:uncharacterized protein LOC126672568 n=1 Tax=Mercurialis annua TaxID=3986 RepID=UPI00215E2EA2|nr:uncharacterized protein LOC126672568 [Mercurialis annua]
MEAIKATNASLQAQVDALKKQVAPRNAPMAYVQVGCEFCGDFNHSGGECLVTGQSMSEQVNYIGGQRQANDPYSNTYNPGWRNHPNFGWRNEEGQGNAQGSNQVGSSFQSNNRPPQQQGHYQGNPHHGNNYGGRPQHSPGFQQPRNTDEGMCLPRPQGGLPSTTENNPREHVKADEPQIVIDIESSIQELPREREEVAIEVEELYVRPPPPLADALREMPQYAKFLKDIITNKRSWDSDATVPIPEVCSSIILNDLPAKLKDPGSFSIPCTIGNMSSINCLCDLGASINLMPLTLFRTLCGDQTVKSTSMVLQLADHLLKRPFGIVEDVLVKVDEFIFPVDFVILNYAVDKECPMILGRPFLNTGRAFIDVHGGKLTLRIDEETVVFDMKKGMRGTIEEEDCMGIDVIDEIVEEQLQENVQLLNEVKRVEICPQQISQVSFHFGIADDEYTEEDEPKPENLNKSNGVTPPSSELPAIVEMKPLPSHL